MIDGNMVRWIGLSCLPPGLGHFFVGRWKAGAVFLAASVVELAVLILAVVRRRLAWFTGDSTYWFSTVAWVIVSLALWIIASASLWRAVIRPDHGVSTESYWHIVQRRLSCDARGLIGITLILIVLHVALFAPFLAA